MTDEKTIEQLEKTIGYLERQNAKLQKEWLVAYNYANGLAEEKRRLEAVFNRALGGESSRILEELRRELASQSAALQNALADVDLLRTKKGFQPKTSLRDPGWKCTAERWKLLHPECRFCGAIEDVEVHHVTPVHVEPSLEMDSRNLMSVCHKCHRSGSRCHPGGDTQKFNIYAPWLAHVETLRRLLGDERVDELIAQSNADLESCGRAPPVPIAA